MRAEIDALLEELQGMRQALTDSQEEMSRAIEDLCQMWRAGGRNLL